VRECRLEVDAQHRREPSALRRDRIRASQNGRVPPSKGRLPSARSICLVMRRQTLRARSALPVASHSSAMSASSSSNPLFASSANLTSRRTRICAGFPWSAQRGDMLPEPGAKAELAACGKASRAAGQDRRNALRYCALLLPARDRDHENAQAATPPSRLAALSAGRWAAQRSSSRVPHR
jgi:hypothetical protein